MSKSVRERTRACKGDLCEKNEKRQARASKIDQKQTRKPKNAKSQATASKIKRERKREQKIDKKRARAARASKNQQGRPR